MKKHQKLELSELVQEIEMLIDDWHFARCPHNETGPIYKNCKGCPHIILCKCLLQLSDIKYAMYKSNGELKNDYL